MERVSVVGERWTAWAFGAALLVACSGGNERTGISDDAGAPSGGAGRPEATGGSSAGQGSETGGTAEGGAAPSGGAGAAAGSSALAGDRGDGGDSGDGGEGGACLEAARDCAGVCEGPGVLLDARCCASGVVDCDGACDGPGLLIGDECCASGQVDCGGTCDGTATGTADDCCASGVRDCADVCDGPGVPLGFSCCASGQVDCAGVCDGPGVQRDVCCESGAMDCAGVCDGPGKLAGEVCCASGAVDCAGVCDGPGLVLASACCASGRVDCAGVCDGRGEIEGTRCCAAGECPAPTCGDGFQNGGESDVDCGGGCSRGCSVGQGCKEASDCAGLSACVLDRCAAPATTLATTLVFDRVIDIARDPTSGTVFATVGPDDRRFANSVIALRAGESRVAWSLRLPGDAGAVAVSDDGTTLYAAVNSLPPGVVRIDLRSRTQSPPFSLGADSFFGPVFAGDLAVVPGDASTVAVNGVFSGSSAGAGVRLYRNGVDRFPALTSGWQTNPAHDHLRVTSIALESASRFYTYDGHSSAFTFGVVDVESAGPHVRDARELVLLEYSNHIRYGNGRVFSSSGQVADPERMTVLGTFPTLGRMAIADDASRVYFFHDDWNTDEVVIECGDPADYTISGKIRIGPPALSARTLGIMTGIELWGEQGLVLQARLGDAMSDRLVLLPDVLSRARGCAPRPQSFARAPIVAPDMPLGSVRGYDLDARFLTSDAAGNVYVSVGPLDERYPNQVVAFEPGSTAVAWSTPAGSDPGPIDVSDAGDVIWVGGNGSPTVRAIDVPSRAAGAPFVIGYRRPGGELYPVEVEAVPGTTRSVAVATRFPWSTGQPGFFIFDAGVSRYALSRQELFFRNLDITTFEFVSDSVMLGAGNYDLTRFEFGATDITPTQILEDAVSDSPAFIRHFGGRVYDAWGYVTDAVTGETLGHLPGMGFTGGLVSHEKRSFVLSKDGSRLYFAQVDSVGEVSIFCYDTTSLSRRGSVAFTLPRPTPDSPVELELYGASGLALRLPKLFVLLPEARRANGCTPLE